MSINSWEELVNRLQDREYRSIFVSEHIDTGLRFQIRALRESKGSQAQVSKEWGKAQPWVCKLESPNYGKYSLSTLKEIAEFYDVGLLVQFVPFSALVDWTLKFPKEALRIPAFAQDMGFVERKKPQLEAVASGKVLEAVTGTFRLSGKILSQGAGWRDIGCRYREPVAQGQPIKLVGSSPEQTQSGAITGVVERQQVVELTPAPENAESRAQNPSATGVVPPPPYRAPVTSIDVNARKTKPGHRTTRRGAVRERSRRERYA